VNDPVAVLLKFGFLAVLFLFLLWVSRSALRDVAGRAGGGYADDTGPTSQPPEQHMDLRSGVFPRIEVIAAMGYEPGTTFDLDGGGITMGRAGSADVNIDDPFASAAHARIFPHGQFMYIEDMGSTNGTFLNGRQLRKPEQLKVADVIRIGDTEYRYQE
jgi:pSer/pThr/pTyr-binding forkhead associated (FHA) protein